jgi:16S rRNA (adenine1518-N6/adenine1519-N6)-dimethyltransferase
LAAAPRRRGGNPPVLKKFGQHFLDDRAILKRIVDALAPTREDTVIEIGPGRGSLTEILAERAGRLIAVEIDRALSARLSERYPGDGRVSIVQADVLETDLHVLAGPEFLLIGNVPYYITTPIVFKALEPPIPRRSVFLVQREVAERMAAHENEDNYGALTVNLSVVARVEVVFDVPPEAFRPPPKVWSSVVILVPLEQPLVPAESLPAFRAFVQNCFGMRRKQIQKVLRSVREVSSETIATALASVGIDATARPENVSPVQFAQLFEILSS